MNLRHNDDDVTREMYKIISNIPESSLLVAANAALTTSLLRKWSWRSTFLALHGLLLTLHALGRRWALLLLLLLHTIAVVLRELALLIGVVLESHGDDCRTRCRITEVICSNMSVDEKSCDCMKKMKLESRILSAGTCQ